MKAVSRPIITTEQKKQAQPCHRSTTSAGGCGSMAGGKSRGGTGRVVRATGVAGTMHPLSSADVGRWGLSVGG